MAQCLSNIKGMGTKETKYCNGCKKDLPIAEFSPRIKDGKRVQRSRCKSCETAAARDYRQRNPEKRRETKRKWAKKNPRSIQKSTKRTFARKLGVCPETAVDEYMSREDICDICGDKSPCLHMDHDHETNDVRGFLCTRCNSGLGYFRDNTELMQKAIEYLQQEPIIKSKDE